MPGLPEQQPPKSKNKSSLQERKFAKHRRQKSVATLTYILTYIKQIKLTNSLHGRGLTTRRKEEKRRGD